MNWLYLATGLSLVINDLSVLFTSILTLKSLIISLIWSWAATEYLAGKGGGSPIRSLRLSPWSPPVSVDILENTSGRDRALSSYHWLTRLAGTLVRPSWITVKSNKVFLSSLLKGSVGAAIILSRTFLAQDSRLPSLFSISILSE